MYAALALREENRPRKRARRPATPGPATPGPATPGPGTPGPGTPTLAITTPPQNRLLPLTLAVDSGYASSVHRDASPVSPMSSESHILSEQSDTQVSSTSSEDTATILDWNPFTAYRHAQDGSTATPTTSLATRALEGDNRKRRLSRVLFDGPSHKRK